MSYHQRTRSGYDFFEVSSLLQKSIRRADIPLAARAANELLPQFAQYVWNRLLIISAEDTDALVTGEIVAMYDAWEIVNRGRRPKDKGRLFIAKAILLLAKAKHSRDADVLNNLVADKFPEDAWQAELQEVEAIIAMDPAHFEIPEWVYDVHTRRGKRMGKTRAQFWRDEEDGLVNKTTVFANLDEMIDSAGATAYVPPQGMLF